MCSRFEAFAPAGIQIVGQVPIKCMTPMKESRVSVRFPVELRRKLAVAARRSGIRESEIVRAAVEQHLAIQDKPLTAYDRAQAAGLIGAARSEPPDLSTNPEYFEGFGSS